MESRSNVNSLVTTALPLAVLYSVFLLLCWTFDVTQDDAYITFRYATNYLAGHGLVWNVGEFVEGNTNFFWLMFLIFFKQLGVPFIVFVKVAGALLSCGTITITYLLVRDACRESAVSSASLIAFGAGLIVATNYSLAYWTMAGLETPLFSFLALLSIYLHQRQSFLLAPALAIALLTRPEGVLLIGFFLLVGVIQSKKLPLFEISVTLITLVTIIPFLVFKWSYFGGVIPNSYYAKTAWDFQQFKDGFTYLWSLYKWYFGFGVLPLLLLFGIKETKPIARVCLLFFGLFSLYIALIGGDVLYAGRFGLPLVAPFAIALTVVSATVFQQRKLQLVGVAVGLVVTLVVILQLALPYESIRGSQKSERALYTQIYETVSQLREVDDSNFSVAASTIGLTGFLLMGHDVIDMVGLTDSTIARHPQELIAGLKSTWRERKYNAEYVLSRRPDYFLFGAGTKPSSPGEKALFLYPAFLNNYRIIPFYTESQRRLIGVYKKMSDSLGALEMSLPVSFINNLHEALSQPSGSNHQKALELLGKARAALDSVGFGYPFIYYYAGVRLAKVGQHSLAIKNMQRALSIDSNLYGAHMSLYLTYYQHSETRELALKHREHLMRLAPWDVPRLDATAGYTKSAE